MLRRVKRIGRFEWLLSLFYFYPFICRDCSYRFTALKWGKRYIKYRKKHRRRRVEQAIPSVVVTQQPESISRV